MIPNLSGKCQFYNDGQRVCATSKCIHPAIMCQKPNCTCQQLHQNCILTTPLQTLIDKMENKNTSTLPYLQNIVNFINQAIKTLQILKQTIYNLMDEGGSLLQQHEKKIRRLLKDNNTFEINGDLVFKVAQSLTQKIDGDKITKKLNSIFDLYDKQTKNTLGELMKILGVNNNEIKNMAVIKKQQPNKSQNSQISKTLKTTKTPTAKNQVDKKHLSINIDNVKTKKAETLPTECYSPVMHISMSYMRLSRSLKSDSISFVSPNQVKNKSKGNHFILLEPSLDDFGSQDVKVGFRVISSEYVNLGASMKEQLSSRHFVWSDNIYDKGHGYLFHQDGNTSSLVNQSKEGQTSFRISNGDTVYLRYSKLNQQLLIQNITRHLSCCLYTPKPKNKTVHFSICLGSFSNSVPEVQFLGLLSS